MSDPSPWSRGSEPRQRQRKQLQPGVCFKHTIRGFAGSRVTTRRFSPINPSPQHPRPSGRDFICGATTSESFNHPLLLPPRPQSKLRCLRLGRAPGKVGAPTEGLPLREIKAGDGFCSQRRSGKGFSFDLYLLFLGLLFCCMGDVESKSSSGAVALL